jgi:hypothetical protein
LNAENSCRFEIVNEYDSIRGNGDSALSAQTSRRNDMKHCAGNGIQHIEAVDAIGVTAQKVHVST